MRASQPPDTSVAFDHVECFRRAARAQNDRDAAAAVELPERALTVVPDDAHYLSYCRVAFGRLGRHIESLNAAREAGRCLTSNTCCNSTHNPSKSSPLMDAPRFAAHFRQMLNAVSAGFDGA